jgi:hypothetical protein
MLIGVQEQVRDTEQECVEHDRQDDKPEGFFDSLDSFFTHCFVI